MTLIKAIEWSVTCDRCDDYCEVDTDFGSYPIMEFRKHLRSKGWKIKRIGWEKFEYLCPTCVNREKEEEMIERGYK